jgi:hypothetical protein
LKEVLKNPIDFIKEVFKTKDIVFLAEDHAVKDNLDFFIKLIPHLHEIGVDCIGMEFGANEDQDVLDRLVTGNKYSYNLARQLMFHYNVIWPYKEYTNVYKAVFDLNQRVSSTEKKMRIINLSYIYDWSEYTLPDTPEKRRKVFHKGYIEDFRYNVLKKEVIDTNKKILILTGTIHALTRYKYKKQESRFFGQIVYDNYPDKTFTICLHEFFRDNNNKSYQLANGYLENVCKTYEDGCGFDLSSSDFGNIKMEGKYLEGYKEVLLKDVFDGYIFLNELNKRKGCTIDCEFINNHSLEEILKQYPDPNWHKPPKSLEEYWQQVKNYVDLDKRRES